MAGAPLFTRSQAAHHLCELGFKIAPATLAKKACVGGGPLFIKAGNRALYRASDLEAWLATESTLKTSTSDTGRPLQPLRDGGAQ